MLHLLRRHPFSIRAHFEFVLALTYAIPADALRPLVRPGLELDEWKDFGFLAAAFVQTRNLRPAGLPRAFGKSFFLAGYRIFCRYKTRSGRKLRGLQILRSDTDRRLMVYLGNLLTHYGYHSAQCVVQRDAARVALRVSSQDGNGDVRLNADIDNGQLPAGSPFSTPREARIFAGPMPYTFDYEPETNSILRVEGVRSGWHPRLVNVTVKELSFLKKSPLSETTPRLASCFYIENIPYRWRRGIREPLA